ncbi:MAG: type II toxin-antitoxin system RelE/ParE family toxin [Burkholderiaceae bacterium]
MPIQAFICVEPRALFTTGRSPRFTNIQKAAERKLVRLDVALSSIFMRAPPGNDLKEYQGAWPVRINDQWRLTFKWGANGPFDVATEDPY